MTIHDAQILHSGRAKSCFDGAKSCLKRPRVPGPRNMNVEDAIQQYQHAQTSFRIIHEWEEAAECMKKSAELMWKMGDKHEAMITLSDCADLLERGNIFDSVEVYKMLISWACDLGRYFDAGRYQQRIAEMLEEGRNLEDAFDAYRHAAHFYSADVKTQHAHHCMVRYATLAADLEDYDVGMEALLELATHCLRESNLTKFNARQFFLQAGLILLAQGHTEELSTRLVEWNVLEVGFINSREHAFLSAMITAHSPDVMDRRLDTFADDLYDFDNLCPLSSWALRMLRRFSTFVQEDDVKDAERKDAKRKADAATIARKKAEMKTFMLQGAVKTADEVDAEKDEGSDEEGEEKTGEAGEGGEGEEGGEAEEETQQTEEEENVQLL